MQAEAQALTLSPADYREVLDGEDQAPPVVDDTQRVSDLCRKVEEAEDASRVAREKAERDRDYRDGKQLTQAEYDALVKRGQPPIAFNVIRSRIEFMLGLEKKQRRDPKAYPRNNPEDVQAADAFTEGLRYAVSEADYASVRSAAWDNIVVEGAGGLELFVKPARDGSYNIGMNTVPWDRLIVDPHSCKPDYSDAGYLGQVVWSDLEDAIAKYGEEARPKLETTLSSPTIGNTWDDKPRKTVWADPRRKRVRIIHLWCKYPEGWAFHEFTKGGILSEGPSPYLDEEGQPYCPLILDSCNIDRENNRYGMVRDLIDPQDEINKRRSKSLHLLSTQGVIADEGAVANINEARRQMAKPDFFIAKQPNSHFEIVRNTDLAMGQVQQMNTAMAYVAQHGPNQALLGKGTEDQSGKAIEAQQAGGLIEQGGALDVLRRMDQRVFKTVALLMKQFWTAEKWIRVTDDELSPQWVGLNVQKPVTRQFQDASGQAFEETLMDPNTGQPVMQVHNNVAELDLDIIVSDAPAVITMDGDNFQSFTQLLGLNLPPPMLKLAVEMHPGLSSKRKKQFVDMLDQMGQPQGPQQPAPPNPAEQIAIETGAAKVDEIRARTEKLKADGAFSAARADHTMRRANTPPDVRQAHPSAI